MMVSKSKLLQGENKSISSTAVETQKKHGVNDNESQQKQNDAILQTKSQKKQLMEKLKEENRMLSNRLLELQKGVDDVQKENSLLKMKTTLTLGSMRLEIDSLEEDRRFLIEKYRELRKKVEETKEDLKLKEMELHTINFLLRRGRSKSI
jgi:chromosome segregation ATPase